MRVLNGALTLILLLFAAVQYNDPDGVVWGVVYGLAGIWTGVAALAPHVLALPPVAGLLALSLVAALGGVVWLWPDEPGWWLIDVWWESEAAREGMGLMVVAVALTAPFIVAIRRLRRRAGSDRRAD